MRGFLTLRPSARVSPRAGGLVARWSGGAPSPGGVAWRVVLLVLCGVIARILRHGSGAVCGSRAIAIQNDAS